MARFPPPPFSVEDALAGAVEALGGGALLVLDPELRVRLATPAAEILLGRVPLGVLAVKLLCGKAEKRPIAEALAAGRAVSAVIPRLGDEDDSLRVSAVPLHRGARVAGWMLLLDALPRRANGPELFQGLWSADPTMKRMFRIVERVARTEATVLVRGETGAGKELVASALHALSQRARGPLRAINCAAVPGPLLESELFGHARGAFTGAVRETPGHFKLADHGTLFLDEVAELSLDLQAKLLRVLETRTVLPVGANKPVAVDVRIVAATHRSLRQEVEQGRFRADLMYRLRVIPIFIPPLRARGGDVVLLAERFIEQMNPRSARKIARISPATQAVLLRYDWPGNVRELRNVLEYAFAIGDGPVLVDGDLPPEVLSPSALGEPTEPLATAPPPLPAASARSPRSPEAARILRALERAGGSRARAAQSLGMSRVTLWRRMKQLGTGELPTP